ncbi:flavin reductase family protein [Lederbergia wuyishanensis]|uniref:Flavin reductase (DIM6/NTAB) family NADH-FMN oxidoreductase RutF n=1 Tax=Lederbergia wuyishanensis TaxID=1347903 RepID=A0ABU0DA86_9BACI|nr:flavin reductase family protein [Lederbergia wuyishanensis]MCJ8010100.1 flavin reductase family protein [Lederbergia wuyishanensis]MDQ0345339.1 flavin reductase (DIM6/NTAB) family NADH-FMN oxidoreductase RutF [Lederbergia wuyishanensis]
MDDRLFRTAMGRFATGVTVITTKINGIVHGMTANAFVSVSLNPKLILVSIGEQAQMNQLLKESGQFAVSILNENQEDMSAYFAGQIKEERTIEFDNFNGIEVIKDSIASMTCTVQNSVVAGDHTLFIAEVTDLRIQDGEPLLFYGGNYRNIK